MQPIRTRNANMVGTWHIRGRGRQRGRLTGRKMRGRSGQPNGGCNPRDRHPRRDRLNPRGMKPCVTRADIGRKRLRGRRIHGLIHNTRGPATARLNHLPRRRIDNIDIVRC